MQKTKKISISIIIVCAFLFGGKSFAAPNYGTTTFFSGKNDKSVPAIEKPVYDVGARGGNKYDSDGNYNGDNSNNNNNNGSGGSLFDEITDGIGSFIDDIISPDNESEKKSLFDAQSDSDSYFNDDSLAEGEFIMGPRGESYENMDEEDAAKYKNRVANKFNFSNSDGSAPKRSRLLFTNIIVPVDLTTQYVIVFLVIAVAIGSAIGYYFWKKETEGNAKHKREIS